MSQTTLEALCHLVPPPSPRPVSPRAPQPQGPVSPLAPVPGAHVTLCPSAPGASVTMCPCNPGSVSPRAPTFIALDTDLLVGSLLCTPIAPPLGLGAGGRPPAPCEGRRGSPSRESTRVPHLGPQHPGWASRVLGGLWPGASALVGRRRPKATWLATQAPVPGGPRPVPCLL